MPLTGRQIVLGVTGGIAAYKAAEIISRLKKAGASVWVVMTQNATEIITPLTLQTLSQHPVAVDTFARPDTWEVEHIALAQRAEAFLVAPATANILAKMAHGLADDMLSTTLLATRAPVFIAPAMNTAMLHHPATEENLQILQARGVRVIAPGCGRLACGAVGDGRLAEPADIVAALTAFFTQQQDFMGKRVLVTAGPTREPLDPVRYITNPSSGKMGYALAKAAQERGAQVTLLSGPVFLDPPKGVERFSFQSTEELLSLMQEHAQEQDVIIQAAAPGDFRPESSEAQKIKKKGQSLTLNLVPNPDVSVWVGEHKQPGQVLVGFAAETELLVENARLKLSKKHLDLLVANDVTRPGSGFGMDTNQVVLVSPGEEETLPQLSKAEVATHILDRVGRILTSPQTQRKA